MQKLWFIYHFAEELESVSEISDSAIEDDEPGVKDEGIYINCAFVSNGDDNKNGSDAVLDTESSEKHETEKLSQTFYEYTENSEQERGCGDNLSQERTDDIAVNVEEKWVLGFKSKVSIGNTDDSTPESKDNSVFELSRNSNSDKLALGNSDKLVQRLINEEVNENSEGFLPENTQSDDSVLKNFDNLTLKNREESVNNRDEKAKRNVTEHIES